MGRRKAQRKEALMLDGDDEYGILADSFSTMLCDPGREEEQLYEDSLLEEAVDALYEKRGATREKALSAIVESFSSKLQHQFVEKTFATLLHQCLNCIKKGSSKEIYLACHTIGLLALTVGFGDNARKIVEESLTPLLQALKSGLESVEIASLLECLAIVTFVGGNPEETERSMQIMWQLIHPKQGSKVLAVRPAAVITAVVSAWSLLLTTLDGWALDPKDWQQFISYLSSLLDQDDRSVRIAAGEALALVFEIGALEKFSAESKGSSNVSDQGGNKSEGLVSIEGLRTEILNQVRELSVEAGGKGTRKKDLNSQRNLFKDILEFLKDGCSPETSMKIGRDSLNASTWSRLIQLNYLKRFLGGGFNKHMQENEFLQDVFEFVPTNSCPDGEYLMSKAEKRYYKSPNSAVNKARTRQLKELRMLSEESRYQFTSSASSTIPK
ncbi:hypothetical protein SLEP1_g21722 [Rubroshorea leprosula]|uniref:Interferon-related developmental regulator 1 n=1 Tax=Rubroshorea leprosula TaxID=152421 RepID=A0AAV5JG45_9ROSI|nr:hypothetical protein SLEP1_g21722 [Rubroshorea leprosula]